MASLLPIGRFSRLTGLTVKQLRHYDETGLLRPAAVDPDSGYRLYARDQVARGEAIRRLRGLELPLEEIAALLAADDPAAVRELLVGHQRRTASRAAELRVLMQGLQPLIDGKESVMGTTSESLDAAAHRRLGVDLFNRTWTLMEKEDRSVTDDDEMVACAHASAYHWLHAEGATAANRARSHWQCSRAHVLVRQPEAALHHAKRCLEIVQESPGAMEEFDLPGAYEALARAHALAGHADESRRFLELGRSAAARIEDADDRGIIEADLGTVLPR